MSNSGIVVPIFPADDFRVVADAAGKVLGCGIIIGYDKDGKMDVRAGGTIDGKRPVLKDWLWLLESFKADLLAGKYSD